MQHCQMHDQARMHTLDSCNLFLLCPDQRNPTGRPICLSAHCTDRTESRAQSIYIHTVQDGRSEAEMDIEFRFDFVVCACARLVLSISSQVLSISSQVLMLMQKDRLETFMMDERARNRRNPCDEDEEALPRLINPSRRKEKVRQGRRQCDRSVLISHGRTVALLGW